MEHHMKFLIIGLGSMGKRRIRNLKALGYTEIAGFDQRKDRIDESWQKYGIKTFDSFDDSIKNFNPNAVIVSTSPKFHMDYAIPCENKNIPCFIEASVTDRIRISDLDQRIRDSKVIMAPSCTMRFYPGPIKVKELISQGVIGDVLNINYQTGQYLPDWHPWEDISEYYVSDTETGAAREIVPFELTWLNDIFGTPETLACVKAKLSKMDAQIDDIYHCLLRYPKNILANLTVEVISRPIATRELRIIGSRGELVMSADENCVRYANTDSPDWIRHLLDSGTVESGYINPEEPYTKEIESFIEAVNSNDQSKFPNTLEDDCRILKILEEMEAKSNE
jgi:predicted dehydrogenase